MADKSGQVDIRSAMADLAANFVSTAEVENILETVTSQAVALMREVHIADVLLIDGERHRSMAATSDIANELDELQIKFGEGPCLAAATADGTVSCTDLTVDTRWPRFAKAAVQAGVRSVLSFQLYFYPATAMSVGGRGALNLFSHDAYEFTLEQQALGAMLATHAASALIAADRQTQFESALGSRDLIGQAKGVLMERFKVDATRAFELMVQLSQDTNKPVRVLARQIVDTAQVE